MTSWLWSSKKPKVIETSEFSVIKELTITDNILGSGAYGTVYAAVYNGKPCVAKIIRDFLITIANPLEQFFKEIKTLNSLQHPSIVQILGVHFKDKSDVPILVMERLWLSVSALLEQKPSQLPLLIKTHILYDVACGLQYLHGQEKPVVHRDLNANNILLTENLDAKIADLGQAKVLDTITGQTLLTRIPGNVHHMAPETFDTKPTYDSKLDIFSFGCTVLHLVTEQFPRPDDGFEESAGSQNLYLKKSEVDRRRKFIDLAAESSILLQNLVQECLKNKPSERLSAFSICSKLKKYLEQLEVESPIQATWYKQDKLNLMQLIQSQSDKLKHAELQSKKLLEENERLSNELQSLQMQNEQITADYNIHVIKLKTENTALTSEKEDLLTQNDDLTVRFNDLQEKYNVLQVIYARQQQEIGHLWSEKRTVNTDSSLYKQLVELQSIYEDEHKRLQQQRKLFNEKDAQLLRLKKERTMQKHKLDEKSYRLSTLESSRLELHELMHSQEAKLSLLEKSNSTLREQLEEKNKLYLKLDKECKDKDESLQRKEAEIRELKKEHTDDKSNIQAQHTREVQGLKDTVKKCKSDLTTYEQVKELLKNKAQYNLDLDKNNKDKNMKLQSELEHLTTSLNQFKRQIDCHEKILKEKAMEAETSENYNFSNMHSLHNFKISWYPYLSLPVKRIRSSAVVVKDKVFVTGGYEQPEDLNSCMSSLEDQDTVFCFHTEKCRCDSIASPVVLGGVASVNGQCVLVGGAEGNTLTGNVYVLCEEGSDEQWKKFSEPVPTPRILPCVCCYGDRWLIVCGGYTCKEGSNLLEAVNVVEILDIIEEEWYTISEEQSPNAFNMLCCAVVNDDLYVIGGSKILKCNLNKLITAATKVPENDAQLWSEIEIQIENLHPFGVVDVNGEPMIIAGISGREDDVTCVLMKDTTDTWRKMSEAVECQHCSAVVVTPTLELLLFGGSESITKENATYTCQGGSCTPSLIVQKAIPPNTNGEQLPSEQLKPVRKFDPIQPPAVSFTGPIHTQQFDHKGGTFQSPVHKVSIVVPPNAIDDGEKVTVHMGATTSGPFDLPEDCKLRSAVVWLGSGSDVVLKRSIAVVVPHSAVFTSPQHHSMMRFLTCEDCEGLNYKFGYMEPSQGKFEIYNEGGLIEVNKTIMVAIVAKSECNHEKSDEESDGDFHDTHEDVKSHSETAVDDQVNSPNNTTPSIRYLAKLFWPSGQLPNSFAAHVYCLQDLPTVWHKVKTQFRQAFYQENEVYPEILETEFTISGDGTELRCVLPCSGSSECDCLSGWEISEIQAEKDVSKPLECMIDPVKYSFIFNHKSPSFGCFEFVFQGALNTDINQDQPCVQKRYGSNGPAPFIIKKVQQDISANDMDT